MKLNKILTEQWENKKFTRITRRISKNITKISRGYILYFDEEFVVIQETDDFRILGKIIIQIEKILDIRYNKDDEFYDKIMELETEKNKLDFSTKIKLKSWAEIFKTFHELDKIVIVECENKKRNSFIIGRIEKVKSKSVFIRYFDATGVFESELTRVRFKAITKVTFEDRYIDVFSKYLKFEN